MPVHYRTLFVTVRPEDINGHLAAHGGKLLIHLPNYFVTSLHQPKITDASLQVFKILVDPQDVNEYTDGGKPMTLIWRGDKRSRNMPHDLVSVEVLPVTAGDPTAAVTKALPVEVCKEAFSEYPDQVKIAAVVASADPELVATLPTAPGQLKAWADSQLEAYAKNVASAT